MDPRTDRGSGPCSQNTRLLRDNCARELIELMSEQASSGSQMGSRAWLPAESSHNTLRNKVNPSHGAFPLMSSLKEQEASQINRNKQSIIDLLEKLVNGIPLVGGSTFEQVEDKAQPAPGPAPDGMICAQQVSLLNLHFTFCVLPELACPRDQAMWPACLFLL